MAATRNALPQLATAGVNCRICPASRSRRQAQIERALADKRIEVKGARRLSCLAAERGNHGSIEAVEGFWPDAAVVPV